MKPKALIAQLGPGDLADLIQENMVKALQEYDRRNKYRHLPARLSITQAARAMSVSRGTVYRWIKSGQLKAGRYPSGRWFVEKEGVVEVSTQEEP